MEKRQQKEARRQENRSRRDDRPVAPGEDPDIAGIVPGPQPSPWDDDLEPEADDEEPDEDDRR